ncbi:MAG: hypothetical protein WCU88_00215 [Elusimicrobiota bacterium]|jgi:predicted transcriptional regulator of viral defense system
MTSAEIIELIGKHGLRVFTTADFLTLTGMAPDAATHALGRLAARDLLARLKKGIWVNKFGGDVHPYEALPYLRAPWPAYVSLYSALADHGIVAEVPHAVYGVSSALPKRYATLIGEFHIHHLPPRLMWGYEARSSGRGSYPMAEPEKAFLDLAYLALTPRSPLELPRKRGRKWNLDKDKLQSYAKRFGYKPLSAWLDSEGIL